jgi:hypothetical protein
VQEIRKFFSNFVDSEYQLWSVCYLEKDNSIFWNRREDFQKKYYQTDIETEVRRNKNPNNEWFEEAKEYLEITQKRKIIEFTNSQDSQNYYAAYLNSKQPNDNTYFEMLITQKASESFLIVSSYITDFDGWFEYSMGEDFGELKRPLKVLKVMKFIAPEKEEDFEEYNSE